MATLFFWTERSFTEVSCFFYEAFYMQAPRNTLELTRYAAFRSSGNFWLWPPRGCRTPIEFNSNRDLASLYRSFAYSNWIHTEQIGTLTSNKAWWITLGTLGVTLLLGRRPSAASFSWTDRFNVLQNDFLATENVLIATKIALLSVMWYLTERGEEKKNFNNNKSWSDNVYGWGGVFS